MSPDNDEFLALVERHQGQIYGFVLSLIGDPHVARDVLQEVNLVLWKKSKTFKMGTNFRAWAFKIARLQVLAQRKVLARDSKRLLFSDELLDTFASEAEEIDDSYEQRSTALQHCLKKLPERQRNVVIKRYLHGVSVAQIATELRLQANAV
ncbi:MAG: sigma-70 family RNA polymerase sigma factor, partial [Verrucomicrobiota bacterium]